MARAREAINEKYADQLVSQTANLDAKAIQASYTSDDESLDVHLLKLLVSRANECRSHPYGRRAYSLWLGRSNGRGL